MRVLFVITRGDEIGGAQSYVRDLALRMARDGHEVHIATGVAGALTTALERGGIEWSLISGMLREIDPLHDVSSVRQLARLIRKVKPDLVSAHSSKAGIIARIAAFQTRRPCIFTAHGWAFTEGVPKPKRLMFRGIERVMAPLATWIICVSDYDRQLAERHGFSPRRLVTIHNGIIDRQPKPRPDGCGPVRVVMTARFAPPKQPGVLLRAIAPLENVECWLIGDGPELDATRDLATQLGIGDRVQFLGQQADVPSLLEQCQIFTLSTDFEGFPISTLEAMRAALPVVVSDVGGAPEAVIDGETGFTVPKRDHEVMRERIMRLAADPELRRRIGSAARAHYLKHFTFETMYRKTIDVYELALADSNG